MTGNFYDKVAKKFGGYKTGSKHFSKFDSGDPEEVFRGRLIGLSSREKTALDIGCADGRFTLSIARHFLKVFAIDESEGMLKVAEKRRLDEGVSNVEFLKMDAGNMDFEDLYFDVVYNRRGPSFYSEYFRVLKEGGYYLEIGIGEKDAMDLKKVFGRGQNYGKWDQPPLELDKLILKRAGFEVNYCRDFYYTEYYETSKELDLFLRGVPIFEDYDSEKDLLNLNNFSRMFFSNKGIELGRHRIVIVARK